MSPWVTPVWGGGVGLPRWVSAGKSAWFLEKATRSYRALSVAINKPGVKTHPAQHLSRGDCSLSPPGVYRWGRRCLEITLLGAASRDSNPDKAGSSVPTTAASQDAKSAVVPCTPHPILHPGPHAILLESLLLPYLRKALRRTDTGSSFCSCFSFKERHPVLSLRPFYSKQTLVTTIFFQLTFPPKPSAIWCLPSSVSTTGGPRDGL